MLKTTIIAIMLLMMSLTAGAGRIAMSHSDYVHLSDAQKDAYIVKLMELTIELESRYKKETAQYGYSQERFERYSKLLNTLKSFFLIDSAYAATGKNSDMSWNRLAQNFNTLMNYQRSTVAGKKDENCIFAGWVSRVIYLNGDKSKPTCAHPDFIDGDRPDRHKTKMSPESVGYPYPDANSSCGKDDKKMIQCNPVIFGYKSATKKSLFCVEAKDGAKNSSFNCMQLALKEDPATPDVDSKQMRLTDLRKRLGDNPTVFAQVWEFTYKTCVCPTVSATSQNTRFFSQDYQNHVRPHRTCYGLMDMMGATALECTDPNAMRFPLTDTKIFSDLRTRIKRESITEDQADVEYTKYLSDMNANKSAEYVRICGGTATPEVVIPKDEPVVVPDPAATYSCTGECTLPAPAAAAGASSGAASASPTTPTTPTTPAAMTCAYVVKKKVGETETVAELDAPPTEVPPNKDATTISIKAKIKGGTEQTVSCNLTYKDAPLPEPEEEDQDEQKEDPSVDVSIDACPGNTCKLTAKPEEGKSEGWSIKWTFKDLPTGVTPPEGWKKPEDKPLEGQVQPETPVTPAGGDVKEITQPKLSKEYNVCAVMTKDNKDSSKGPSCESIPAQAAAPVVPPKPAGGTAAAGPNNTPAPPQTQIRGSSDTSAIGIK